jgi:3-oxoacyl-[acyl-carrier protein] reductase
MAQQSKLLAGKVALVTGGNRGIGRAIALRLAADGARLMLAARDESRLGETVRTIEAAGGTAQALALDLRREGAQEALLRATLDAFGGLDILVNNAGATKRGDFSSFSDGDWADGFALKFFGTVRLTRAAWPHLKTRGGSVVIISGTGGRTPGSQFSIGGSVNAALLALTKALADLGIEDGVQVNAINPGFVRSDRWRSRVATRAARDGIAEAEAGARLLREAAVTRLGEPEDVANLVAYMTGPAGRFLHGALVDLDGGQTKTI